MHVHYFPQRVFEAIWKFFEARGHGLWDVRSKLHGEALVAALRAQGVRRFTTLVYAHKPGMADFLNTFVRDEVQRAPELIPFGTIFAGDGDCEARALRLFEEYGFRGIKLHPFVSGEDLDDPRLMAVYAVMQRLGRILICHPGSGPVYARRDGAARVRRVLEAFPTLRVVVAHCGAFEYGDYEAVGEAFPNVWFDTAMNCVHDTVFPRSCPGRDFFLRFQDRVVFGSDFPNIPYPYESQVEALRALHLGADVEAKLFEGNAVRLLR